MWMGDRASDHIVCISHGPRQDAALVACRVDRFLSQLARFHGVHFISAWWREETRLCDRQPLASSSEMMDGWVDKRERERELCGGDTYLRAYVNVCTYVRQTGQLAS